ncbi:Tat pathway signal sequence domain protein [Streptomyces sp. ISL-36]|uniref:phage baseplate protein n=1 Tax=Streptomyces sp. ISL-36 TaxID=2819182 RepID=UPI001BE82058|nr:Tat pathway signal sequence domain protein [Streptomyces sp. ISL-36]MBT2445385.1 Tat pathway signal sequence domain protein [Streptomyces sp. ISL-36]
MSVSVEGQIDLAGPVGKLLHRRPLKNSTVMQSFGIDPVTGEIFVLQVVQGGLTLSGESAPVSGADRVSHGDLCVTRLSPAGAITGFMYLRGFGHGVSMAVENRAGVSYLWTETASKPNSKDEGYGTAITHFQFRSNTVLDYGSSLHATPYTPAAGATGVTCTIDPTTNRLVVRFNLSGMKYESYDLAKAAAGVWEPLARIPQPDPNGVFQGYASLGGVLYMLAGQAIAADNPANPFPGNTYLTAVDWATGAVLDQQHVLAAPGLEYREPEGMAVSVRDGVPHLHFGFACEDPGPRTCTILSFSGAPEIDGVKVLTDWQPLTLAAGVTADQNAPKGRLISIAGTTTLQLSGGVKGTFDADDIIATLPDSLTPSMVARANVSRNNSAGFCVARVEADSDRQLRLYGGRTTNVITWAQLDNFSAVWR